jgi:glutathione peroxidase
VKWNFEKFLINRAGEVVARFAPTVVPDSPEVLDAIEQALAEFDGPEAASRHSDA